MKNLKVKALVYMLGFIGAGVAGGLTIHTIAKLLGPDLTVNVLIGSVLVFLLYQVYGLVLARLESEARIEELSKDDRSRLTRYCPNAIIWTYCNKRS
jgi:hypothetical protein